MATTKAQALPSSRTIQDRTQGPVCVQDDGTQGLEHTEPLGSMCGLMSPGQKLTWKRQWLAGLSALSTHKDAHRHPLNFPYRHASPKGSSEGPGMTLRMQSS